MTYLSVVWDDRDWVATKHFLDSSIYGQYRKYIDGMVIGEIKPPSLNGGFTLYMQNRESFDQGHRRKFVKDLKEKFKEFEEITPDSFEKD